MLVLRSVCRGRLLNLERLFGLEVVPAVAGPGPTRNDKGQARFFWKVAKSSAGTDNKATAASSEPEPKTGNGNTEQDADLARPIDDSKSDLNDKKVTSNPADEGASGKKDLEQRMKNLRLELEKVTAENQKVLTQQKDWENKYLRTLAEAENIRSKLSKNIQETKLNSTVQFCRNITEISDLLRDAIRSVRSEDLDSTSTSADSHQSQNQLKVLHDGLAMTEQRLLQVFRFHGLQEINPVGEQFNPIEHEAIEQQSSPGKVPGTVLFVSKLGFKLNGRILRKADVGVAATDPTRKWKW